MSRFLPVGKGVKGAAGFLLAAIPALGAVLTGLAITGGLVGHMARDHPLASYGAFGLAVLAIFAGGVAAFALRGVSTEEQVAIFAGLGLVVVSLLFGVYAGVQTWGDRAQRSEEHTSELQSHVNLVCRLLLEKKNSQKSAKTLGYLEDSNTNV